eukprot:g7931.t1
MRPGAFILAVRGRSVRAHTQPDGMLCHGNSQTAHSGCQVVAPKTWLQLRGHLCKRKQPETQQTRRKEKDTGQRTQGVSLPAQAAGQVGGPLSARALRYLVSLSARPPPGALLVMVR